jgi:hypothetical protein
MIRALLDFRYLAQAPAINDEHCNKISAALKEFHDHKHAILEAHAHVGKGNKLIDNWHIPKLKLMQSIILNIRANGVPIQFMANTMEHAHIDVIKVLSCSSNNQKYEEQICHHLDHSDKCRCFDLATSICQAQMVFSPMGLGARNNNEISDMEDGNSDTKSEENPVCISSTFSLLDWIQPVSNLSGPLRLL